MAKWKQLSNGYLTSTPIMQFILMTMLFPLWSIANALNDVLITQFKSVFELSNFASALVQSAFFGGYFIMAIPAAMLMKKKSYVSAILAGLIFYIIGCILFFPASHMATYNMFLVAIFAIALGLSFLETSANTYSTLLGPEKYSTFRINLSQTFTPIGNICGILLGKYLIFQEGDSLSTKMAQMSTEQIHAFRLDMLQYTLTPYKIIVCILLVLFLLFVFVKFPKCKPIINANNNSEEKPVKLFSLNTIKYMFSVKRFRRGLLAMFLYNGMQTAIWSFTIRLALSMDASINERTAANYMIASFIIFFVGRILASALLSKISSSKVLWWYSLCGCLCLAYVVFIPNFSVMYAVVLSSACMGPGYPTIYAKSLQNVAPSYREAAAAAMVMSIIGGAIFPAILGLAIDITGIMHIAFIIPLICFAVIAWFFYTEIQEDRKLGTI
ncbi:L-fucose:H+ symporter permease [Pectinatus cerevisiiphilus]|uniref:FHS family L-fucose permease-like MFS transporter n=1 Tax=Pectinatus cerevisiiphilus TaxID=86956 RepID=A0A4R3K6H1_9FIRM|nr:L-fucose:H+ symporter permease [Pectinatus cerevisiiphilus]TCS78419.1 FHS family L-fucose permease-like MFS transporter [Pectinatus cerevisiiphilus]